MCQIGPNLNWCCCCYCSCCKLLMLLLLLLLLWPDKWSMGCSFCCCYCSCCKLLILMLLLLLLLWPVKWSLHCFSHIVVAVVATAVSSCCCCYYCCNLLMLMLALLLLLLCTKSFLEKKLKFYFAPLPVAFRFIRVFLWNSFSWFSKLNFHFSLEISVVVDNGLVLVVVL